MANLVRSRAVKDVADKTMAVGGHRNKIDVARLRELDDLI